MTEGRKQQPAFPARLRAFLRSRNGRLTALVCAILLVALIVTVVLLMSDGEEDARLAGWPSERMEGIQPPEQGTLVKVYQTDTVIAVYFEAFPESALVPYLQALGIPPEGDAPYIVRKGEDRFLAVAYDAETERLSLTITPAM